MIRFTSIAFLLGCLLHYSFSYAQEGDSGGRPKGSSERPVWVADRGNGIYTNPILYADYSDPDAVRVGDDYYMTASSFNCIPGLPVLYSKDLVNWTIVGHALPRQYPEEVYDKPQHGNGVWAPAIRWHKGEFYIYYPDPDYGIYVVKARNAAGPWSKPVLVVGGKGLIDPCPLFEGDGKVWLVNAWAGSRAEVNSLLTMRPLQPDGLSVAGEARMVYDGHDRQPTIEGPKLYKRNGYYYILAPAGGVTTGWQLALRSRNIYGPYEEKIVMDQGTTVVNGPHQGAWVDTKAGESWFLHFQDRGAYGRITHLQPLHWVNDWPVIGVDKDGDGKGEPVLSYKKPNVGLVGAGQESDEFNGDRPGLQWQWHANPKITWMAEIPGSGYLRLFAMKQPVGGKNFWEVPNLLLQKFPAPDFTATTKMRLVAEQDGKKAGLLVMGGDYSYLALVKDAGGFAIEQVVCKNAEKGEEEKIVAKQALVMDVGTRNASPMVYCRVEVSAPDAQCRFSYSLDGNTYTSIGDAFFAKPDKWIGAKLGLFCLSPSESRNGGYADVDWFRVGPLEMTRGAGGVQIQSEWVKAALDYCVRQAARTVEMTTDPTRMPRSIDKGQTNWKYVPVQDWTSGFWPGILWLAYEYTGDGAWKIRADSASLALMPVAYHKGYDHDLGFQLYTSLGNGYRLTGGASYERILYKRALLAGADSLARLFNPKVGTILSWPAMVSKMGWPHNTIIDNMINLELLFWAAGEGGGLHLKDIAVRHAETTMHNHFRPDHSAYHVVVYDTVTGKRIKGVTHQGYSDSSIPGAFAGR